MIILLRQARDRHARYGTDNSKERPGFSSVGTITVQIPGSKWALGGGKSIFVRYHKNVLGLPFITAGDFVFDDAALQIYYKPG